MNCIYVVITGEVQGVGFRAHVLHHARKLHLNGWVKNVPDGTVAAVFCGDSSSLVAIVDICTQGSYLSEVHAVVKKHYSPSEDFTDFTIR